MNWADVIAPIGAFIIGAIGHAVISPHLKGKPPAPRSEWEWIERQKKAELDAKNAKKEQ